MIELEPKTILESIEIIRAVKSLFVEQSPYLPMYSALGGAFIGAISAFFPNYLINMLKDRHEKRSMTLQLYAEIKSTLELIEHRRYVSSIEQIVEKFILEQISSSRYQVEISDDIFLIYKNSLARLGILDIDIQVKVVQFYQILDAIIQDVKPGGLLNTKDASVETYQETLRLIKRTQLLGSEILSIVEKRYRIAGR